MAKVYIAEFAKMGREWGGNGIAAAQAPAVAEQVVAIGGTTTQSSVFGGSTRVIRVHTDAICSIAIGADPTATANTARMAAGATEYFSVEPGHKLAAITNT